MARPLRFEYPGAVYHVMARGDGGKAIFEDDRDRADFVARLGKTCGSHGWRVHAWVLMGNHFHLLLETPEANLVSGMKLLLGGFSQAWNRRRKRRGHVFQGRYKSVPVSGAESDEWYFRIVADYIHLNPARARLTGGRRGTLASYRWSSLPAYAAGKRNGPDWQDCERVLRAFELALDGRGRRAYIAWLEARAAAGGAVDPEAMAALKRGWYLGGESFKDRLLGLLDSGWRVQGKEGRREAPKKEHGHREAERLTLRAARALGLPETLPDLSSLKKGDRRKLLVATLLRERTTVGNAWIAERLSMGHFSAVSRAVSAVGKDAELQRDLKKLQRNSKFKD